MLNTAEDDDQDIARSSYADMLHDDERNHAYYMAIRANVNHLVRSPEWNPNGNRFFKCCDIGTGSGLLSMMIVKTFRDLNYEHFHVTAFEAFKPMAECAKRVIEANKMSDKITVIPTRSEDHGENPQFDLLVAELLDTELIGEGCLLTYRHAVQNLCSPNCIFIPSEAHIYVQTLRSEDIWKRNIDAIGCPGCPGLPEIDDMQLSQARKRLGITPLFVEEKIFTFKFCDIDSLKLYEHKIIQVGGGFVKRPSIAMWWDIVMYDEVLFDKYLKSEHKHSFSTLSCGPDWIRKELYEERDRFIKETYGRDVWREHWIQGVYYLRDCDDSTHFYDGIHAYHDSHSLWFSSRELKEQRSCMCGHHRTLSRTDFSLRSEEIFDNIGDNNIVARDAGNWYGKGLADLLNPHLYGTERPSPFKKVTIVCAQVGFKNLNRIKMRVGQCQGFDLSLLDDLIDNASRRVDASTEPHHLIEYEFTQLGIPFPLVTLEASDATTSLEHVHNVELDVPKSRTKEELKKSWALIFWPDFRVQKPFGRGTAVLPGGWDPRCGPLNHENISANFKQLVHFLHDHPALDQDPLPDRIKLKIKIDSNGISVTRDWKEPR